MENVLLLRIYIYFAVENLWKTLWKKCVNVENVNSFQEIQRFEQVLNIEIVDTY